MKDSHMLFVLLAILITPFLPFILKGKCPACHKRKLESLEANELKDGGNDPFNAYFRCNACQARFVRHKSGPMEPIVEKTITTDAVT